MLIPVICWFQDNPLTPPIQKKDEGRSPEWVGFSTVSFNKTT